MEFDGATMLGTPGWLEIGLDRSDGEPALRLFAKLEEQAGRGVITRLVIVGDRLDSSVLRAIPIGRIESALNHPRLGFPTGLIQELDPATLEELARRGELFPAEWDAINGGLDSYLEKVPEYKSEIHIRRRPTARPPLTRPDGTDPDGFSRRVAAAYNQVILTTGHPAPVLAAEADVPVTTVHRWIMEARRRGHLPPARRGRAG